MLSCYLLFGSTPLTVILPCSPTHLNKLEVSLSAFYVYLGVDLDLRAIGIDAAENIVYEIFDN